MRALLATSALALAAAAFPVSLSAQGVIPPSTESTASADIGASADVTFTPAPDQQLEIDAWPVEQKGKYAAWPASHQEYFWSLDADQRKGWWALTAEQKAQVYAMTPDQRAQVWPSIVAQVNGQAVPPAAATPPVESAAAPAASGAMSADAAASVPANNMARIASSAGKTYPLCSKTVTDSCRNPGGV